MVEITAPQKHETVLDPACGTAGFLISAYKHILRNNFPAKRSSRVHRTDPTDPSVHKKSPVPLTPDEKARLAKNFTGYDISPDMVRLSLVNLYLHGFTDPHIYEYDTLTSQDRWNEHADVILANPPFMSPKGGIRPHNRFSVQSKRSEVLFVDYMAEHLNPDGRAAIIVPEGIIFQSQTAYKQLRKMLVEEYLIAVVSLPAGVFQPYSGVKTSILVLDKALARRCPAVAFFKIENDGFGLGAQRRPIDQNDLPAAVAAITNYKVRITNGEDLPGPASAPATLSTTSATASQLNTTDPPGPATTHAPTASRTSAASSASESSADLSAPSDPSDPTTPTVDYLVVPKEKIAENGDYNLSGERYQENGIRSSHFPVVPLGEVAEVIAGQSPPGESYNESGEGTPFYQGKTEFGEMFIGAPTKWTTAPQRFALANDILMSVRAPVGPVNLATQRICIGRGLAAIRPLDDCLLSLYAFYILRSLEKEITGDAGATFASINRGDIEKIQIPLPLLTVQQEIVAEIEGYQKVINGARAVLDNYRPHITIHPDWPMVELGQICSFKNGLNFHKTSSGHTVRIIGVSDFQTNLYAPIVDLDEVHLDSPLAEEYLLKAGDILFVRSNGNPDLVGRSIIVGEIIEPTTFSGFTIRARIEDDRALPIFFANFFKSRDFAEMIKTVGQGANIRNLSQSILNALTIPLPPLVTQQVIVAEIEAEQALVAANRELIERMEKKIRQTLSRVWGQESP